MSEAPRVVADIMTRQVVTLNEADNLLQLEEGMDRLSLRHLPVVDGDRLVGLMSHRDVLRLMVGPSQATSPVSAAQRHNVAEHTFVAHAMTRDPTTVRPDTPLREAAELLATNKFGCLPVVEEGGRLVGIVTEHDFLKMLARQLP